jgi:hypothetical protein
VTTVVQAKIYVFWLKLYVFTGLIVLKVESERSGWEEK